MYDTRASPSSSFIKSPSSPSDNFDPTENEEGESEVLVEPRFKYLRLLNDISRVNTKFERVIRIIYLL